MQDGASGRAGAVGHRVLISTDLGGDPDDTQSLVHLLHYSDLLKVEGLVSTTGPNSRNRADRIAEWVRRVDLDALRAAGHTGLQREVDVLGTVRQGSTRPGGPVAAAATEGSRRIVECALARDPAGLGRPLWILAWGSLTDVAQALHDAPGIAPRLRLYSIGSSNTDHDPASRYYLVEGLRHRWPGLWWIENGVPPRLSHDTFRGYYLGGPDDPAWNVRTFIPRHVRGRGTRRGAFREVLGDAFPAAGRPRRILKEGDSPSFLYLLSPARGGVGDVDDPTRDSWGGRFRRPDPANHPNYFTDLDASAETCRETIARWRPAFLADWAARWAWYDALAR